MSNPAPDWRPSRPLAFACLAGSMILVGMYMTLTKPLVPVFGIMLVAWLRFLFASLLMVRWFRPKAGESPLTPRLHARLFGMSFFGNFLFSIVMMAGMARTPAVAAGVVLATIPAMVAFFGWIFLRERLTRRVALAIVCAVSGVALLRLTAAPPATGGSPAVAGSETLGLLFLIITVCCEAIYAIFGKVLTRDLRPKRIAAYVNLWGLILTTPFGLHAAWHFDFAAVSWGMWGLLLFYTLAASMWSVWLWMTGLKTVDAAEAGVMTVLLPTAASLTGVLVLGESFTAGQVVALGIGLTGVVLASWRRRR